jgi:hypothetical protein
VHSQLFRHYQIVAIRRLNRREGHALINASGLGYFHCLPTRTDCFFSGLSLTFPELWPLPGLSLNSVCLYP